ncbi:hypothetical protein CLV46_1052 [Diaminobutyricimonas aerilata]|uniref:Uncharacterized protein n=1 Tax=Diaminobutyricimonas aerilata TaxID=1162967 RepID=A0A2M9CHV8_9MICO|nr:hypothetical protein [Diaminobutyricimonas aerilata]PJJ71503.1 hypothetical protein CLV46_1052 [Diaminobutyricimonas aerilata]
MLTLAAQVDENAVTPGVIGFIAIILVAGATILLLLDMTRRVRRTRYRSEARERLEAEARGEILPEDTPDGPAADGRTPDAPR